MKKLLLEDLSKELGVSKTLISMVLNGKGDHYGISKKTQEVVLKKIEEYNYTPNKFAKALRTGKSNLIGLIVADIANPFYSTIAKNVEQHLFGKGYNLMVCSSNEDENRERNLIHLLTEQQSVDGLMIASTAKQPEAFMPLHRRKYPMVFIDRYINEFDTNYVITDNYKGSFALTEQLIHSGHKNILLLNVTPSYISPLADRVRGYRDAMEQNNIAKNDLLFREINFNNIQSEIETVLEECMNENVDAVYALNNHLATGYLHALKTERFADHYGKARLACFDDIDLFNYIEPSPMSVSQPVEDLGVQATELLLDLISIAREERSTQIKHCRFGSSTVNQLRFKQLDFCQRIKQIDVPGR